MPRPTHRPSFAARTALVLIAGLATSSGPAVAAPVALELSSPLRVTTVMKCTISEEGRLKDCLILSRTADVPGLDERVLASARLFKMRPKTTDGRPVAGGTVKLPIILNCPRTEPTAARCKWVGMVLRRR